jgi:hypothetical protein
VGPRRGHDPRLDRRDLIHHQASAGALGQPDELTPGACETAAVTEDLTPYDHRILSGPVGGFGKYLMERSYDEGMRSAEWTLAGRWRVEYRKRLTERLARLEQDERDAVLEIVRTALVDSLHGLLHGIAHDGDRIRLLFEGHDVAAESDGLHGDLFLFLRLLSAYPYDAGSSLDLGSQSGD